MCQAAPPDQLERRLQDSQKAATGSSGPAGRRTWALAGQPLAGIKSGGNGAYKDETKTYQEEGVTYTQSLADIRKALSDAPALFANFNRFGGGAVDALGGVLGVIDFFGGDSVTDRIGGLGNASQGVAGVAEIFQTSASAARVVKVAGVLGAGIQAGIGISELFDKNFAEGAVDIAAGAAIFIPLLITGPVGMIAVAGPRRRA
ncbi:hypothetical protein IV102_25030 [bacterium]|nr:hypothetical protein [bacterium]